MKKALVFVLAAIMCLSLVGCGASGSSSGGGSQNSDIPAPETSTGINMFVSETDDTVTFIDGLGNENTVHKHPQRVVFIKNCFLEMWYLVGGTAIARTNETDYIPEEAMDLEDIGQFSDVSAEAVLALEPDLVVMTLESSGGGNNAVDMQQILKDNGIEYIGCVANDNPLENTLNLLYLFSKVLGTEDQYQAVSDEILGSIDTTVAEYAGDSEEAPTFAVMGVYPSASYICSNANQVAEILTWLNAENILKEEDMVGEDTTRIDFSIEELVARDPDYIFIQSYLSEDEVRGQVETNIATLDGWANLSAVQNDHVIYVPIGYSLHRLNDRYPEAIEYFAKAIYGDAQ